MSKSLVYFDGDDAAGDFNLWETDGTVAGTIELGGILSDEDISGANNAGLHPAPLIVFHHHLYFSGLDGNGAIGLWVSDGTVTGTEEIGGFKDAGVDGASLGGL